MTLLVIYTKISVIYFIYSTENSYDFFYSPKYLNLYLHNCKTGCSPGWMPWAVAPSAPPSARHAATDNTCGMKYKGSLNRSSANFCFGQTLYSGTLPYLRDYAAPPLTLVQRRCSYLLSAVQAELIVLCSRTLSHQAAPCLLRSYRPKLI